MTDAEFAELLRVNFITITDDFLDRLFTFYNDNENEE